MAKKILYLDKESFIDWFFDEDMIETFVHDQGVMSELKENGTFTLKIEELLSGAGYLPDSVASEGQEVVLDDLGEVDMNHYDEIKFK
jgi:hypothetical protein